MLSLPARMYCIRNPNSSNTSGAGTGNPKAPEGRAVADEMRHGKLHSSLHSDRNREGKYHEEQSYEQRLPVPPSRTDFYVQKATR